MAMSLRMRLAISAACAVMAVLACVLYGSSVRASVEQRRDQAVARYGGDVVTVVVCNRALEAGEVVGAADVASADWVSSLVPQGALTRVEDALGREVTVPTAANAPLCDLNFRDVTQLVEIPSGCVALSVPLTDSLGIFSGVAVGTHVQAYRLEDEVARLLSADALVLNVPAAGSFAGTGLLTIAVPAKDVTPMLAASASGLLRLVVPAADVRAPVAYGTGDVEPVGEAGGSDQADDVEPETGQADGDDQAGEDGQAGGADKGAAPSAEPEAGAGDKDREVTPEGDD